MAWLDGIQDLSVARERAEKALRTPIGLMSPLWFAFGAAASAGVAWWWMTRWAKPVNLEAFMTAPVSKAPVEVVATLEAQAEPVAVLEPETPTPAEVAPEPEPVVVEAAPVVVEAPPAMLEAEPEVVEAPPVVVEMAEDLTALVGIGPKIATALAERGVTRFAHLAGWTAEDLAAFDADMNLKGKAIRADFVGQARQLIAEQP